MNSIQYRFPVLSCVNAQSLDALEEILREMDYKVYELDGSRIEDAQTFFQIATDVLPLDPPLTQGGQVNWDALSDSMWGGLDRLGEPRVAIVWTRAERMLDHGLPDLLVASTCFQDVAVSVHSPQDGISTIVDLLVFLVGEGDNFKGLEAFADI
jgi:hypothetical protein